MRIAALYDVHGNLPALEAVLRDVREAAVDQVIVGGDVFPGPMPRETLERLLGLDLPVHFIRGNGDREVLTRMRGEESTTVPEPYREAMGWVAAALDPAHEALLAAWPGTLRFDALESGPVLFCHATPRSDSEIFTRLTAEERLLPVFDPAGVPLVVCGHTHMQFDRMIGRTRVVNAGSVGMPFGDPRACWLLLGPDVELRQTSYDVESAAVRMQATGYPGAADFVRKYILRPPAEAEMLEVFGKAELR